MSEVSQNHYSNANEFLAYWAKMGRWNLHEAAVLSLGRDPKIITIERIQKARGTDKYDDRARMIKSAIESNKIAYYVCVVERKYDVDPLSFVRWAKQFDIDIPEQLAEMVFLYHQERDFKSLYEQAIAANNVLKENTEILQNENAKLKQRKSSMQQKLNTAQAYFSAVVDDKFSGVSRIQNVVSALERQGIAPSKNTVSKHYKEGKVARVSKDNLGQESE